VPVVNICAIWCHLAQSRKAALVTPPINVALRNGLTLTVKLVLELFDLDDIEGLGDVLPKQLAQRGLIECCYCETAETPNDSATRRTGRNDGDRDAHAGFAAA